MVMLSNCDRLLRKGKMIARGNEVASRLCQNPRIFNLNHLNLKVEQRNRLASPLERQDFLAVLPTGLGKSLIFQLFIIADEIGSRVSCLAGIYKVLSMTSFQKPETWVYQLLEARSAPKRGTFFRLQVYKRVGISQVEEAYKRVGKSVVSQREVNI